MKLRFNGIGVAVSEITCDAYHVYRIDGTIVPGVTEILAPFCDFSRIPKDVLEYKRTLGRAVHKAIEYFEAGELDMESVDETALPYLYSWQAFKDAKPLRVVGAEQIVYSKRYGFCGRKDLDVEFLDEPGVIWQLDAKCVVKMMPETALQTAAYAQATNENGTYKITKRGGLQLQPDGSMAKLYPYTNRTDLNVFLNALNLRNWMLNNR